MGEMKQVGSDQDQYSETKMDFEVMVVVVMIDPIEVKVEMGVEMKVEVRVFGPNWIRFSFSMMMMASHLDIVLHRSLLPFFDVWKKDSWYCLYLYS